jgi:hypothetical protein
MNSKLLIGLLLLILVPARAQKCSYIQNKISGMDGTRLIITKPVIVASENTIGKLEIWSTLIGDTAITLALVSYPQKMTTVSKGDSITLILEDNSKLYLTIHQDAVATGKEVLKLTILSIPDSEILQMLELYPVYKVSVSTSEGELQYSIKNRKQAHAISNSIGCIKEYVKEH